MWRPKYKITWKDQKLTPKEAAGGALWWRRLLSSHRASCWQDWLGRVELLAPLCREGCCWRASDTWLSARHLVLLKGRAWIPVTWATDSGMDRATLSPCSVKQYPFLVSPAPYCIDLLSQLFELPQGLHQGSGQTFLKLLWFVHMGFLSWKKNFSLALNNLCWR